VYGDVEQTVPVDYATTVCYLFVQLGARGVSLLVDSGYFGVGDRLDGILSAVPPGVTLKCLLLLVRGHVV
jgi:hypothetical protein